MMSATDVVAKRTVVVISDSTGETASRAAKVALEQFFGISSGEQRFVNIRTPQAVTEAIEYAVKRRAFIVYTLVEEPLRKHAATMIEQTGVPAIDLLKYLLPAMGRWLGKMPGREPGHKVDDAYFERIKVMDFVRRLDDGQNPQDLYQAEAVVLGISRTSKSPVCQWLGVEGIRAANVPLVLGIPPSRTIFTVDQRRVFVLTMRATRLQGIRISRLPELGLTSQDNYANPQYIEREIEMVETLLEQNRKWTPIDVTMRAIEETSAIILSHLQRRFGNGDAR